MSCSGAGMSPALLLRLMFSRIRSMICSTSICCTFVHHGVLPIVGVHASVQHWPWPAHLFGRSDTTLDAAECAVLHGDAAGRRCPLLDGTPYYLSSAIDSRGCRVGWPSAGKGEPDRDLDRLGNGRRGEASVGRRSGDSRISDWMKRSAWPLEQGREGAREALAEPAGEAEGGDQAGAIGRAVIG